MLWRRLRDNAKREAAVEAMVANADTVSVQMPLPGMNYPVKLECVYLHWQSPSQTKGARYESVTHAMEVLSRLGVISVMTMAQSTYAQVKISSMQLRRLQKVGCLPVLTRYSTDSMPSVPHNDDQP